MTVDQPETELLSILPRVVVFFFGIVGAVDHSCMTKGGVAEGPQEFVKDNGIEEKGWNGASSDDGTLNQIPFQEKSSHREQLFERKIEITKENFLS